MAPVPPVALNVIVPFEPAQFGFVPVAINEMEVGDTMVTVLVTVHPFASVAVMVYVPALVAMYGDVATTLFTLYTIAPTPPVELNAIVPFCPAQIGFVPVAVKFMALGIVITTLLEV